MSPNEYGIQLAQALPPISDEQVEETARILATVEPDGQVAA